MYIIEKTDIVKGVDSPLSTLNYLAEVYLPQFIYRSVIL